MEGLRILKKKQTKNKNQPNPQRNGEAWHVRQAKKPL